MKWPSPFVIYRINAEGRLEPVFFAQDIKKAKYWLTYIAEVGDVLCKTPAHPKHSQTTAAPEYWSHKADARKLSQAEAEWKRIMSIKGGSGDLSQAEPPPPNATVG